MALPTAVQQESWTLGELVELKCELRSSMRAPDLWVQGSTTERGR